MERSMPRRSTSSRSVDPPSPFLSDDTTATVRNLLAEAQALSVRLAALNEVSVAMQRSADRDTVLQVMADQARWVLDFQLCTISMRDEYGLQQKILRVTPAIREESLPFHRPAIERVMEQGYALIQDMIPATDHPPEGMQSAMLLPLFDRGTVVGTLNFYAAKAKQYRQDDLRIATALAMQVSAILQNTRLLAEVTKAHDEMQTILESIGDGVLVLDLHGKVLLLNRAFREMVPQIAPLINGQSIFYAITTAATEQPILSEATADNLIKQMEELLRGSKTSQNGIIPLYDGRYMAWVGTLLLKAGQHEGIVLTVRDVTAQIELEHLREDMLRMLVHDFRTPLSSISMAVELLSSYHREGVTDQHEAMIEIVRNSANRLIEQINMLLDISKLEIGRLSLDIEKVSLHKLVHAATRSMSPLLQGANQALEVMVAEELPLLRADGELLRRVIDNLLSNACKFTPDNGRIVIGAFVHESNQQIEVWFRDTGPGVPEHEQERIFEKYAQLQVSHRRRGTGLGLTFCRLVVEAHGGQIGVRNAPSGGSIFWFRLPL
jgi:two-component system, NtrC family, sensor histidine kinase KinB